LIGEILDAGGNFVEMEGYMPLENNNRPCVGGPNYQGGMRFDGVENAILYLKRYFVVLPCRINEIWNVARIENLMPPHP